MRSVNRNLFLVSEQTREIDNSELHSHALDEHQSLLPNVPTLVVVIGERTRNLPPRGCKEGRNCLKVQPPLEVSGKRAYFYLHKDRNTHVHEYLTQLCTYLRCFDE